MEVAQYGRYSVAVFPTTEFKRKYGKIWREAAINNPLELGNTSKKSVKSIIKRFVL
jgi:hypothetical protein